MIEKRHTCGTIARQYCKSISKLSRIAEQFISQDDRDDNSKQDDMMGLLQKCLDTLEAYQDAYRKLKDNKTKLSQEELFEIYESAYVYYKIVHNTVLNQVPHLKGFQLVKKQSNTNDRKLMEIYNMLVKSLLNDDKIAHIKMFIKEHSISETSQSSSLDFSIETGSFISISQLQQLLQSYDDSTLLIDIRQRSEFTKVHIKAKNVICIEPISFKGAYTDVEVEKKSLITSPKKEIELFRMRNSFKYIILYTKEDNGKTHNNFYIKQEMVLLDLLLNRSFAKPLSPGTKIFVLKAGILNWISQHGNCVSEPTEKEDARGDGIYLSGNISGLSLQNLPKLSPSISSSMDSSMQEMMSSSFVTPQDGLHQIQQQPPVLKNYVPSSSSPSASPLSSPAPLQLPLASHISNVHKFAQYPETPHLSAEENGNSNFEHHPRISQTNTKTLTATNKYSSTHQPPRILMSSSASNGGTFGNMNGNPKPPNQPVPLLPQLPSRASSSPSPVRYTKKYDIDFTVGLENMGNSCYINCIVQCLLGTHELTNIFLNNSYEKHINLNSKLGSKGVLAKYFAKLVHTMHHHGSFKFNEKNKPVQPLQFKMACGSINSLFKESGQQDCQEFCQFLLDGLHEDLNQCGGNAPLKSLSEQAEKMRERLSLRIASSIEWERFLTTDFSVIVDLFQGQYASQLKCQICGHTSTTYQPFSVLSVPVPRTKSCSLLDCFKEFTKTEKLETEEEWSCPQCKKKQPSTKKLTITRLPRNLIIHLKRFDNMMNKNNVFVNYPFLLDLTPFWANDFDGRLPPGVNDELPTRGQVPPFSYKLYGVASHMGSLYGGHYTAYVDKGMNRGWYYFDDTNYRPVKSGTECITSNAYVLFYRRVYGV